MVKMGGSDPENRRGWQNIVGRCFLLCLLGAYGIHKIYFEKVPGIVIRTNSGKVQGIVSKSREGREYYEWLGIPYAKPPLGALRFASPQPIEPWSDIRDGSHYGQFCTQLDIIFRKIVGGEDCLFLNIHTPKKALEADKLLPVLFSIHGGLFTVGYSNIYRPTYFMDEDVVLVTINYRLGALGLLSTGDNVVRGSMGLKDQSMALKWVSENIANFGGDPSKITVMGESAGGVSAGLHMLSPMSNGLIAGIICQSGNALSRWNVQSDPQRQAKYIAEGLNCPTDTSENMIACLRRVSAYDLSLTNAKVVDSDHVREDMFAAVIEDYGDGDAFLPAHPLELYKSKTVKKIPLLVGVTNNEGSFLAIEIFRNDSFKDFVRQDWKRALRHIAFLNPEHMKHASKLGEFYLGPNWNKTFDPLERFDAISDVAGDNLMNVVLNEIVKTHSKIAPAYAYWYSQKGPTLAHVFRKTKKQWNAVLELIFYTAVDLVNEYVFGIMPPDFGVSHADELILQFEIPPLFNLKPSDPLHDFSKDFMKTWVMFAEGKRPEFRGTKFPANSPDDISFVEIKDTQEPRIIRFPFPERLKLWQEVYEEIN